HTIGDDGTSDPVRFNDTDALYLDGERLILVNGVNGHDGAEYRTKKDVFTKIVLRNVESLEGGGSLGATWFEAFDKQGRILTYGGLQQADLGSRFEGTAVGYAPIPGIWPAGSVSADPILDQQQRDRLALDQVLVSKTLVRFAWALCSIRDRCGNE